MPPPDTRNPVGSGPEGSVPRVFGSELGLRIADAAGEMLGLHALVNEGSELVPDAPRWSNRVLAARQYTISAGASEIQRNIIGERVPGAAEGVNHTTVKTPSWRFDLPAVLSKDPLGLC